MYTIEKLEDTLNGCYAGVYGEVVTHDEYRISKVKDKESYQWIFDFGANVGVFTRYALAQFPNAKVIAVEPNEENFHYLTKFTERERVIFVNKAIGSGQLWHNKGARNGSGESYVSSGIGYHHDEMVDAVNLGAVEFSEIETILPAELIKKYVRRGEKFLVKMDIEGGEHAAFFDNESMRLMREADYFCAELHLYALTGGIMYDEAAQSLGKAIGEFMKSHSCKLDNVIFTATKN